MKRLARLLLAASIACFSAHPAAAGRIAKSEVPAEVLAAFKKVYPKAKVRKCLREEREGRTVYALEAGDGRGLRTLVLTASGEVLEKRERIALKELPETVKRSVRTKYPEADISSAQRVVRGETVSYALELRMGSEKESILVDADGTDRLLRK